MSRPRPATAPSPGRTLICDPLVFREKFDREHFLLEHTLASEPVFQLPRLVELASATAASRPADVYYDAGDIGIGQRWDTATSGSLPVDETIHTEHRDPGRMDRTLARRAGSRVREAAQSKIPTSWNSWVMSSNA